jgi:hypothetical protein
MKDISELPPFQKAALVLGVLACAILLSFATCESPVSQAPPPPPPCKDVKLNAIMTEECPHPEHVLETHVLSASVCRCKGNIPKEEPGIIDKILKRTNSEKEK